MNEDSEMERQYQEALADWENRGPIGFLIKFLEEMEKRNKL